MQHTTIASCTESDSVLWCSSKHIWNVSNGSASIPPPHAATKIRARKEMRNMKNLYANSQRLRELGAPVFGTDNDHSRVGAMKVRKAGPQRAARGAPGSAGAEAGRHARAPPPSPEGA